jgi:protein deglycase
MKRTLLLLANGFEAYEASVFTDVLGWNKFEGDGTTEVVTVGMSSLVKSTWSFTIVPEIQISEVNVDDYDALAIPGGFEEAGFYEDAYSEAFLDLIRQFDKKGKIIASICVAALPVGRSGVLKGRNGTTYHVNNSKRQSQLAEYGVNIINEPIIIDKNIITSYCPSTAIGVAFMLLEMLTSTDNCDKVKRLMGF